MIFSATILLSALLLFQVQPLIAKLILPWFGGSAAVWTSCMLFFQVALLAGYAYAHWLNGQPRRKQSLIHVVLLVVSLASLPILPGAAFKPAGGADPLIHIIALLSATVGLPCFMLAATSPLLQSWHARAQGGPMPYRLFALSNLGSMLGLLTYPVLVEPYLTNRQQAWIWSGTYVVFMLGCATVALRSRSTPTDAVSAEPGTEAAHAPCWSDRLLWMALAAVASALLLAVTQHLTQNLAPIPLLWVAPLALYLLSFILCFDSDKWYRRGLFVPIGFLALPAMAYASSVGGTPSELKPAIGFFCVALFVLCMLCHGELAARRPRAGHLTLFYLMVAAGGALGGLLIGVCAPYVFNALYDLPVVLSLSGVLCVYLLWRDDALQVPGNNTAHAAGRWSWRRSPGARATVLTLSSGLAAGVAGFLAYDAYGKLADSRMLTRNFYGALRVYDHTPGAGTRGPVRTLMHGTIVHGSQFLRPEYAGLATTYFTEASGVGLAMGALQSQGRMNVGIIGLGAGTLSSYARPGDHYAFYEINPAVVHIAQTQFRFLRNCPVSCDVLLGDARLTLESEASRQFDLLVIDAFSGDAIPVHLLTREAFKLYWRHLKPDGVLAVHVSNRYLWLGPVIEMAAAENAKVAAAFALEEVDEDLQVADPVWVLVTSRPGFFQQPPVNDAALMIMPVPGMQMWSDDYSNLYRLLRD